MHTVNKRCGLALCVPFGIVCFLMPANAFSFAAGGAALVVTTALRTLLLAFVAWLLRSWGRLIWRGFYKYVLRGVVLHVVRLVIAFHPGMTNARARSIYRGVVHNAKETMQNIRGWRLVASIVGMVGATVSLALVLVWVGFVRVVQWVTQPLVDIVARTTVGKALWAWWYALRALLYATATSWYERHYVRYRRANTRVLRKNIKRYRNRFHNGKGNGNK